jgi:glycosyltransferase involved in cell wall biosynthesis
MRVCFLAGTLERGGAERQLVYMLRAAQNAGIKVRVLALTQGEFFEKEIKDLGVQIDCVGASKNKLNRLLAIINNLRRQPADIVQSSHFYTNIYAGAAGRALNIVSIGAVRSDLTSELAAHGRLAKWQLNLPRHLVVNSRFAYERLVNYGVKPERVDLVRNVVQTAPEKYSNAPSDILNILFVGRLVRLKRADLFIKLAAALEKRLPEHALNFQIVGDGVLRDELEQLAKSLDLQSNKISFLGWQDDLSRIYQNSAALVLTSEYEGTPNVLLEAMAHGVPVIASNVGGAAEIVDKSRGFLIEKTDEKGFAAALAELIVNPARHELGANGKHFVAENHSLAELQKRLVEVYDKLLSAK